MNAQTIIETIAIAALILLADACGRKSSTKSGQSRVEMGAPLGESSPGGVLPLRIVTVFNNPSNTPLSALFKDVSIRPVLMITSVRSSLKFVSSPQASAA